MEKYGTVRQATGDNIIRCRKDAFPCRITNARIQTHTRNIYHLMFFHGKNVYANAPQCYVTRTLPVAFKCAKRLLASSRNLLHIVNN
jgi:hypothetical protein